MPHHIGVIPPRDLVQGLQDPNRDLVPRLVVHLPCMPPQTVGVRVFIPCRKSYQDLNCLQ